MGHCWDITFSKVMIFYAYIDSFLDIMLYLLFFFPWNTGLAYPLQIVVDPVCKGRREGSTETTPVLPVFLLGVLLLCHRSWEAVHLHSSLAGRVGGIY